MVCPSDRAMMTWRAGSFYTGIAKNERNHSSAVILVAEMLFCFHPTSNNKPPLFCSLLRTVNLWPSGRYRTLCHDNCSTVTKASKWWLRLIESSHCLADRDLNTVYNKINASVDTTAPCLRKLRPWATIRSKLIELHVPTSRFLFVHRTIRKILTTLIAQRQFLPTYHQLAGQYVINTKTTIIHHDTTTASVVVNTKTCKYHCKRWQTT